MALATITYEDECIEPYAEFLSTLKKYSYTIKVNGMLFEFLDFDRQNVHRLHLQPVSDDLEPVGQSSWLNVGIFSIP